MTEPAVSGQTAPKEVVTPQSAASASEHREVTAEGSQANSSIVDEAVGRASNVHTESMAANETVQQKPNPHAEQIVKLSHAMFRATLVWGGITTVVGAVLFTVLFGAAGLLGSLVGSAVAFASAFGTILMMRKTANLPPSFIMIAALGGYTAKLIIVFVVLTLLRGVDALNPKALAFTMLASILIAAIAEFRAFKNAKIPTLIVS